MFTNYADFEIDVLPRDRDIFPLFLHTPGGDARGALRLPTGDPVYQGLIDRLVALDTDEDLLKRIGQILFDALFQRQIKDVFIRSQAMLKDGQGLRIKLKIAPTEDAVATLPWELLYDADLAGPLSMLDASIVRYIPNPNRIPTLKTDLPLKVLLTGAQTSPQMGVEQELREIKAALGRLGAYVQITVEPHLTFPRFQQLLRQDFHIWHFVAQGVLGRNGDAGQVYFEDPGGGKVVGADQLGIMLNRSSVRLVVLDTDTGTWPAADSLHGIAPALIRAQIPAVITTRFANAEHATRSFAGEFYRTLAEGFPLDACVIEGRKAVMNTTGLGRPDWGMPVVYTDAPDCQLFDLPAALRGLSDAHIISNPPVDGRPGAEVASHPSGALLFQPPVVTIERLPRPPRPPRPLIGFLDRTAERQSVASLLEPRGGAWVHGPRGCGLSALLREAANLPTDRLLPDGVVYVEGEIEPSHPNDIVQRLFYRFYKPSTPIQVDPGTAQTYLGDLRALFVLDNLTLDHPDDLMQLTDTLAEGAVLVAAASESSGIFSDLPLCGLPRAEATRLCATQAQLNGDQPDTAALLERLCAALDDLPLPLLLAARLIRCRAATLQQLVGVLEDLPRPAPQLMERAVGAERTSLIVAPAQAGQNGAREALVRAARLTLTALDQDELAVLSAVVASRPDASLAMLTEGSLLPAMIVDGALARLADLGLVIRSSDRAAVASMSLRHVLELLLQPKQARSRLAAFLVAAAPLHAGNLSWLGQERGNILEGIRTLLSEGQAAHAGALARAVQPLVVLRGLWDTWGDVIDWAAEAAQKSGDRALAAWALHERGTRAGLLGDRNAAASALDRALRLRKQLGDQEGAAVTRHNIAYLDLLPPGAPPGSLRERLRRLPRRAIIWGTIVALLLGVGTATTLALVDYTPNGVNDAANTLEDQAVAIAVLQNDTPRRGRIDPSTLSIIASPAHGAATLSTTAGEIRYIPSPNFYGDDRLTYQICDDRQDCTRADVLITIAPVNDLPVVQNKTLQTAEDTPVMIDLLAGASDVEDQNLTAVAGPKSDQGGAVALSGGMAMYTPPPNFFGTDSFIYTVTDSDGGSTRATVTITVTPVNDSPVARSDTEQTQEDTPLTIPAARLLGQASDVDTDTLTLSQVGPASDRGGTVALAGDAVTYTPAPDFNGTDAFSYTVNDGQGGSATATVTVTVAAVNDPPVAKNDTASTDEDQALTIPATALLANDSDPEQDQLIVSGADPISAQGGAVTVSGDAIAYTPRRDFNGKDSFNYTVSDGHGGAAKGNVTIAVAPVNDPPVAADDSATTNEDSPITIAVLANDRDVEKDIKPASVQITQKPANGATSVDSRTGTILYTPNPDFNGADRLSYRICDTGNACDSASVTITIAPVNDTPQANPDQINAVEDTPLPIQINTLISNDTDPDNDQLQITKVSGTRVRGGKINRDGDTLYYTPPPNFNGNDGFTYTVEDGKGGSAQASVTIVVSPVNDPPIAIDDSTTTFVNQPVTIAVLENDSDVDGDKIQIIKAGPTRAGGTVVVSGNTIIYTPPARQIIPAPTPTPGLPPSGPVFGPIPTIIDFVGTDVFAYMVSDGHGGEATATVTVTVQQPPPPIIK